jgi:hypothetical protein
MEAARIALHADKSESALVSRELTRRECYVSASCL